MSPQPVPSLMDQATYDVMADNLRSLGLSEDEVLERLAFITVVPGDDPAIQTFPEPAAGVKV